MKEVDPSGSMFYVPGASVTLGGVIPIPDETYKGPGMVPQMKKG